MIIPHPLAAELKKPVGMFGSGHFTIKPPRHESSKQNRRLIDTAEAREEIDQLPISTDASNP
jgi:hypothetical protein